MDERLVSGRLPRPERIICRARQRRTHHIDHARARRPPGRDAGHARRAPSAVIGAVAVVLALVVTLLGCTPAPDREGAAPDRDPVAQEGDASASQAATLAAALTAQLEARIHLLAALSGAALAGDAEAAVATGEALAERRAQVAVALADADVPDGDDLLDVLSVQDRLLRDHATATSEVDRRRSRARLVPSAARLALVAESMTGGRLPADVGRPLASAHLTSLLAIADRGRSPGGAAAGAPVTEAIASGRRLLEPFLLALSTEEELDGSPLGDAARLRAELASVLLEHGFGAARIVLGAPGGEALVTGAGDRLATTLAASYGTAVAGDVRARWLEQVAATDDLVGAGAARRRASGSSERVAAGRDAALAGERSDEAIARLAELLAATAGDERVAGSVRSSLEAHRRALLALSSAATADVAGRWPAAAGAALELSELAAPLASAVTRQKSLG